MNNSVSSKDNSGSYDVIIVGAGPSAAGLLHGLLTRLVENDGVRQLRIAVIERGACPRHHDASNVLNHDDTISNDAINECAVDCKNCNCGVGREHDAKMPMPTGTSNSNSQITNEVAAVTPRMNRFDHTHPSTYSLRHWFTAAHFTSRPTDRYEMLKQNDGDGGGGGIFLRSSSTQSSVLSPLPPSPTMLHITTPQRCMNNRIIDVPTGTGWGGTTNINAGLVVEPWYGCGKAPNEDMRRGGSRGDFDTWPGKWKGGEMIKVAMHKILMSMRENDSLRPKHDVSSLFEASNSTNNQMPCHWVMQEMSQGEYTKFQPVVTSSTTVPACDLNAEERKGLGHTESKRVNYFSALIEPLMLKHPELESCVTFLSGLQVERILIDSKNGTPRAWGVEVMPTSNGISDGRQFIIESRREIIVCAGAIGSPSLLLASGIGHIDDLMAAGIEPWYDLPSDVGIHRDSANICEIHTNLPVGHNLRDHVILPRILVTPYRQKESSLSENSVRGSLYLDFPKKGEEDVGSAITTKIELQLIDGIQMDAMITHAAAAALRRDWTLSIGQITLKVPFTWITSAYDFVRFILNSVFSFRVFQIETRLHTASINVCLLNPQSTGKVHVIYRRKRDDDKDIMQSSPSRLSECRVLINPAYLSDPRDVDALWMGWEASSSVRRQWFGNCRELLPGLPFVAAHYLKSSIASIFKAFESIVNDDFTKKCSMPVWFSSYAAEFANPYYHWCGTCAMGEETTDANVLAAMEQSAFVVDEHLCVRGIAGLSVCDASVFPGCISAPTALTCAALGQAASAFANL